MSKARQARRIARAWATETTLQVIDAEQREADRREMSVTELRFWKARGVNLDAPVERAFGERIEEIAAKRRLGVAARHNIVDEVS